jgi:hypothetical protein
MMVLAVSLFILDEFSYHGHRYMPFKFYKDLFLGEEMAKVAIF